MKTYQRPSLLSEVVSADTAIASNVVCETCLPSDYTGQWVCAATDSRGKEGYIVLDDVHKIGYYCGALSSHGCSE